MNQRSQFTHLASDLAVFCLCIQKSGAMYEKSGIFNSNSVPTYRTRTITNKHTVPTYRTRTITKKAYRTNVLYLLAKIEAYRTVLPSLIKTYTKDVLKKHTGTL